MVASFPASLLSLVISSSPIRFPSLLPFLPFLLLLSFFSLLSHSPPLPNYLPFLSYPPSFPPFTPPFPTPPLSPFFCFLFTLSLYLSSCFLLTQREFIRLLLTFLFSSLSLVIRSLFLAEESTF